MAGKHPRVVPELRGRIELFGRCLNSDEFEPVWE